MASRGELLTAEGLEKAAKLFSRPASSSEGHIQVVSNYYGVNSESVNGSTAKIDMEITDLGWIDSQLIYYPPRTKHASKTSLSYSLVSEPGYAMTYGSDGKTPVEKRVIPGIVAWKIEGPVPTPWAPVNTVVRYVLERRNYATDPAVKKNADETLVKLLRLH